MFCLKPPAKARNRRIHPTKYCARFFEKNNCLDIFLNKIHWNSVLRLYSHRKWNFKEFCPILMVVGARKCHFMPVLYLSKNAHFWRGRIWQKKRNHVMGLLWIKKPWMKKSSMVLFFQGAFRFFIKKLLRSVPKRV